MINELLGQLGLSDKEISVYLAVQQQGKVTHANVAKLTKINRTTVYSVAKELIDRGIIAEDLGSSTTYLVAKPVRELVDSITREKQKIDKKALIAEKAVLELQSLVGQIKYSIPKVVFIAEDQLEDYLYKQTPKWNQSIHESKDLYWGFQDASLIKYYEKWIDWWWENNSSWGIELRLLSNESAEKIKKKQFPNRHIKFWQSSKDFTATTWINGDYIIMIVTNERPHYLIEIYDKVMAHNYRELFRGIWDTVPEPKEDAS
ncbi:MAG TPA: helix-turn-helix domain-containing protein [Patescibacteria group bacterium]|jgi:sugar-specific transcriptional regulator TrmB|nr:helix-turn-helix domain-containing protein [Patescibacteria group bacterium]